MAGDRQVPEHLGHLTATSRVEGQYLSPGLEKFGVSRDEEAGLRTVLGRERRVARTHPDSVALGFQRTGVGLVAKVRRSAVQIADHRRMPLDQLLSLGGVQPAEERCHPDRLRGPRIGQPATERMVRTPRCRAGRRPGEGALLAADGPARRARHDSRRERGGDQSPTAALFP